MKKFLSLLLSAALLLALLGACTAGGPESTVNSPDPTAGPSASVPPTDAVQEPSLGLPSEEPTPEPGDEPTPEPTSEPTPEPTPESTPDPMPEPTKEPASTHHPEESHHVEPSHHPEPTPHPEESHHVEPSHHPEPTPTPTTEPGDDPEPSESTTPGIPGGVVIPGFGGWGGGNTDPDPQPSVDVDVPEDPSNVDFDTFFNTLSGKYGFPDSVSDVGIETADIFYPGLADLDLLQFGYYIPAMTGNENVVEIVLLQVKNPADGYKAVKILQDRIDNMRNGGAVYPQDVKAWNNSAEVVSSGGCVMLVVNSNYKDIITDFKALF